MPEKSVFQRAIDAWEKTGRTGVLFTDATQEDYEHAKDVVPPHAEGVVGFLMGGKHHWQPDGTYVYFGFFAFPDGGHACALMTEDQFDGINSGHRVAFTN